jgi:hypothetical protein
MKNMKELISKFHNNTKRFFYLLGVLALLYALLGLIYLNGYVVGQGIGYACILFTIDYFINKKEIDENEKNSKWKKYKNIFWWSIFVFLLISILIMFITLFINL